MRTQPVMPNALLTGTVVVIPAGVVDFCAAPLMPRDAAQAQDRSASRAP